MLRVVKHRTKQFSRCPRRPPGLGLETFGNRVLTWAFGYSLYRCPFHGVYAELFGRTFCNSDGCLEEGYTTVAVASDRLAVDCVMSEVGALGILSHSGPQMDGIAPPGQDLRSRTRLAISKLVERRRPTLAIGHGSAELAIREAMEVEAKLIAGASFRPACRVVMIDMAVICVHP